MTEKIERKGSEVRTGVISLWSEKGYGFIHENRDNRLLRFYFHAGYIASGIPVTGAKAYFTEAVNPRGPAAVDVQVVS